MAEKKENSKNFDINFFKQYIELIKKILFKITKIRSPNLFLYSMLLGILMNYLNRRAVP